MLSCWIKIQAPEIMSKKAQTWILPEKKGPKKLRIICAEVSSGPTFCRYIELGNRDGFGESYIVVKDVKC